MRKERDKEIELVIQRLEADMSSAKEECERAAENRWGGREGAPDSLSCLLSLCRELWTCAGAGDLPCGCSTGLCPLLL